MKRALVLALAIICAGVGLVGALSFAFFIIGVLSAPDHGGDLWLALPAFLIPGALGAAVLVAARALYRWWQRMAKSPTKAH